LAQGSRCGQDERACCAGRAAAMGGGLLVGPPCLRD